MIRHLFSIIWNQRKSNIWIGAELLVVFVAMWYIVDYMLVVGYTRALPNGFDIEHTYLVALSALDEASENYIPEDQKTTKTGEDLLQIMDRIRSYPAVEAVSVSMRAHPYTSDFNRTNIGADTTKYLNPRRRMVSPDFFSVFRIPMTDGSTIPADRLLNNTVVITPDIEHELFGETSALGQSVHSMANKENYLEKGKKVVAVTAPIRDSEFEKYDYNYFDIITPAVIAGAGPNDLYNFELCVRVNPDADNNFAEHFRRDMDTQLSVGNLFLLDVTPISAIRRDYVREEMNTLRTQLSIFFFLLLNIFLGIIGTFWVRTESRKGEMGLRIALGGTRRSLMSILTWEGLLLLCLATIPSILICFNLGMMEVVETSRLNFTILRFCSGTLLTFALMALMIIVGIWYPARQATKIQPAEALHYE